MRARIHTLDVEVEELAEDFLLDLKSSQVGAGRVLA